MAEPRWDAYALLAIGGGGVAYCVARLAAMAAHAIHLAASRIKGGAR